ncbi:MAG: PPC domain-containing protein, partial [Pseudomonadota bacterium]
DDAGNSQALANSVTLDNTGAAAITGSIGANNDEFDFYRFTGQAGSVTIQLSGLIQNADLALLGSDGTVLVSSTNSGTTNESVTFATTAATQYTVRLQSGGTGDTTYALSLAHQTTGGRVDAINGTVVTSGDAGNSSRSAAEVILDSRNSALIVGSVGFGRDRGDVYRVEASSTGQLDAVLSGVTSIVEVLVYDNNLRLITTAQANAETQGDVSFSAQAGQSYYLQLVSSFRGQSNYDLQISAGATGNADTINGSAVTGDDSSNSRTSANTVTFTDANPAAITGSVGYGSDSADFYQFEIANSGSITVNLTGLRQDIDLYLFDSSGNRVDQSIRGSSNDESLSYYGQAGNTYFVAVAPYRSASSNYTLNIMPPAENSGNPDIANGYQIRGGDAENLASRANLLLLQNDGSASLSGSVGFGTDTADHYIFFAARDGSYTLNLQGLSSDATLAVNNVGTNGEAGASVGTVQNAGTGSDQSITFNASIGQVFGFSITDGGAGTNYTLSLSSQAVTRAADMINGTAIIGNDASNALANPSNITLNLDSSDVITGSAGYDSDYADNYSFTAQTSGAYRFAMSGLNADLDLVLQSGTSLIGSSNASGSADESFTANLVSGQTYNLSVYPFGGNNSSDYRVAITATQTTQTQDQINNVPVSGGDVGNTRNDNAVIDVDTNVTQVSGSVGVGEDSADFYMLRGSADRQITITLSNLQGNVDMRIYEGDGTTPVASSTNIDTQNESITYNFRAGTAAYLEIVPIDGANSAYTIDVGSATASTGAQDRIGTTPVNNTGDAGNTLDNATLVTLPDTGSVTISGSTGYDGDTGDYYQFVAGGSGSFTANLTGLNADLDMVLVDGQGNLLLNMWRAGNTDEVASYQVVQGETYALHVVPYSDARSEYSLTLSAPGASAGSTDDFTADTTTTANVAVGGTLTGAIERVGDVDWIAFQATANTNYTIALDGDSTGGSALQDPAIQGIYDQAGTLVNGTRDDDGGAGRNSGLTFSAPNAGTYYVAASSSGRATGNYRLSVAEGQSVTDDFAGDTTTTGTIAPGGRLSGVIGTNNDVDFIRINLTSGNNYRFDVQGASSNAGTLDDPAIVGIYDVRGQLIANTANDDGGNLNDARSDYAAQADGVHYVAISNGRGGGTGSYTLDVT